MFYCIVIDCEHAKACQSKEPLIRVALSSYVNSVIVFVSAYHHKWVFIFSIEICVLCSLNRYSKVLKKY